MTGWTSCMTVYLSLELLIFSKHVNRIDFTHLEKDCFPGMHLCTLNLRFVQHFTKNLFTLLEHRVMNGSTAGGTHVIREAPGSVGIVAVASMAIPHEGWALGYFIVFQFSWTQAFPW